MKRILLYIVFALTLMSSSWAADVNSKGVADNLYKNGDYQAAAKMYENVLSEQGESSALYFNLGNAYYKSEQIAKAVLNYERALLLSPDDKDIRFNLDMARSKTVDKITPITEIFLVTWVKALIHWLSVDAWAYVGLTTFILMLVGLYFYFFASRMDWRKFGFFGALVCLVISISANCFAYNQHESLIHRNTAIIMSPSVTIKSTPTDNGTDLFVLHEGTKVLIKDATIKDWKEVQTEDGNVGWVPAKNIEVI